VKSLLSSKPALWFLFLFNLTVAAVAPFAVEGTQGLVTSAGMGAVSLGAGLSLLRSGKQRPAGEAMQARRGPDRARW
jgi:hypothetical protein